MLIKAYWLVALNINRTTIADLDDGISGANIDATQAGVLNIGARDSNRPARLL